MCPKKSRTFELSGFKLVLFVVGFILAIILIPVVAIVAFGTTFELGVAAWEEMAKNIPARWGTAAYAAGLTVAILTGWALPAVSRYAKTFSGWKRTLTLILLQLSGGIVAAGGVVGLSLPNIRWGYGWVLLWNAAQLFLALGVLLFAVVRIIYATGEGEGGE